MLEKIKYLYRAYRYKYILDKEEIGFIINHLNEGDIAIDVGAHKGAYLYWMQKTVGKKGKIFAFEPQRKLFKYLSFVKKIMNFNHVFLEEKGLSKKSTGRATFFIPKTKKGSSPGASLETKAEDSIYEKVEIQLSNLDACFYEKNIHPQLIKIDVEGHEYQVLLGAEKLIQSCQPCIIMECEKRHLKEINIDEVFQLLKGWGYNGYFYHQKKRIAILDFDVNVHQKIGEGRFWEASDYVNNFMFVPQ